MSIDDKVQTVVIGGGQAGLAAGYFLSIKGDRFVILDDNLRTGDSWRRRWDSLRLFTPCKYNSLPGKPFPGADFYFPTKDETAAYLENYASSLNLPVQHNVKVIRLSRHEGSYKIATSAGSLLTKNVIVATGAYQKPYIPIFAAALNPTIFQVHSAAYCNPQQVPAQNVLVVGAGNSGAEIGLELARAGKHVWLAGRDVGSIPADRFGRILGGRPYWFILSRLLSINTPVGRKMRDNVFRHGTPLIRLNRQVVTEAGIENAPRVKDVVSGQPQMEDGHLLPVDGVVWATGFRPDYSWIDMPIFDESSYPRHQRGVVPEAPGLYFTGLPFQTALSSALLGGTGPDAEYIVRKIS